MPKRKLWRVKTKFKIALISVSFYLYYICAEFIITYVIFTVNTAFYESDGGELEVEEEASIRQAVGENSVSCNLSYVLKYYSLIFSDSRRFEASCLRALRKDIFKQIQLGASYGHCM